MGESNWTNKGEREISERERGGIKEIRESGVNREKDDMKERRGIEGVNRGNEGWMAESGMNWEIRGLMGESGVEWGNQGLNGRIRGWMGEFIKNMMAKIKN